MKTFKLAFVGPAQVHQALSDIDDYWDLQVPMESLSDLEWQFSGDNDSPDIAEDTSVIILFSRLYKSNPSLFADLVSFSAPYSAVCILTPEVDRNTYVAEMEMTIRNRQIEYAQDDEAYNSNTPFYIVDYGKALEGIYSAISDYVNNPIIDESVRASIRPMLPDEGGLTEDIIEDFSDYENDGELILPEAPKGAKGIVISVTSSKGGSGKSTVAIGTGSYIALASEDAAIRGLVPRPLKVCLVDLDIRDGQHLILMGARKPKTMMDIIGNGGPTPDNIKDAVWHSEKTKCDYIFAPKRPRSAKEIPNSFFAELIQQLRAMYDVIILDTSVNYLDPLGEDVAYPLSDRILLVSDMGKSSILGCTRWILEEMYAEERGDKNISPEKVGVVINKALSNVNMSAQKIQKAVKDLPIISMIPCDTDLVVYASNVSELQQILKVPLINEAFRDISEALLPDAILGTVEL